MKFKDCITLLDYKEDAYNSYMNLQNTLLKMIDSHKKRMEGKTFDSIIWETIGTVVCLSVCVLIFHLLEGTCGNLIYLSTYIVTLALIASLLLDNFTNLLYYGKINKWNKSIILLRTRLQIGMKCIVENQKEILEAKHYDWEYKLKPGETILGKAVEMESALVNVDSLKGAFLPTLKDILYYTDAVLITIFGSVVFSNIATKNVDSFLRSIFPELDDGSPQSGWFAVVILVACGVEVLMARLIWGQTDCSVRNKTLIAILLGPMFFFIVVIFGSLMISSVLKTLFVIIAVGIGVCISASGSGG